MSAGRWDSSPDSRSMPTVDLQWWLSSTDVFCTGRGHIQNEFHTDLETGWTLIKHRSTPHTDTCHGCMYLVEGCQVVSGLDEEGLIDPRMVHIVGGRCHQTQEHVQRTQLLCQLQRVKDTCSHFKWTWHSGKTPWRAEFIMILLTGVSFLATVNWWWLIKVPFVIEVQQRTYLNNYIYL